MSKYGQFGGQYVAETLMPALVELEAGFDKLQGDTVFWNELNDLLRDYVGRATPLTHAKKISKELGRAVYLKREDLNHTGAHKINNCLGQALLAMRLGKTRIIAETGAGQHGVATATACALFGLECVIYMGAKDVERQRLNVMRMRMLGAKVHPVESGSATLKDAMNDAMREWVATVSTTHYMVGSVAGPHPFPKIVRAFQAVIGDETKSQLQVLPAAVVACVGGGSNAAGIFSAFVQDESVALYGVEAAGTDLHGEGTHAASILRGKVGVLHGSKTMLLTDVDGMIHEAHSISAGLDYPGVGPEHAFWHHSGRVKYLARTDDEALEAMQWLAKKEGIICALETSHAVAALREVATDFSGNGDERPIVLCLSGRGDKDMPTVAGRIGGL